MNDPATQNTTEQKYIIGDCIEIMQSFDDNQFDLCITDPPYNVGLKYENYNDAIPPDDYLIFSKKWFKETKRISKVIIFTPGYVNLEMWLTKIEYGKIAILHVPNGTSSSNLGGWNHYEPILIYGKVSLGKNVFTHNNTVQNDVCDHPCPKQIAAWSDIIKTVRPKPERIIDPFLGSGTTLRVCRELDIDCIGIEIDGYYRNVIETRSKKYIARLDSFL